MARFCAVVSRFGALALWMATLPACVESADDECSDADCGTSTGAGSEGGSSGEGGGAASGGSEGSAGGDESTTSGADSTGGTQTSGTTTSGTGSTTTGTDAGPSSGTDSGTSSGTDSSTSGSTSGTGSTDTTGAVIPTFDGDIIPIFEQSCGSKTAGCHDREAYGANSGSDCRGWLSLENAAIGSQFYAGPRQGEATGCPDAGLYDRLMMDAWQECGGLMPYVEPGDLSQSFLWAKIEGTLLCDIGGGNTGDIMPPAGTLTLTAEDRATIEAWILAGAPQ